MEINTTSYFFKNFQKNKLPYYDKLIKNVEEFINYPSAFIDDKDIIKYWKKYVYPSNNVEDKATIFDFASLSFYLYNEGYEITDHPNLLYKIASSEEVSDEESKLSQEDFSKLIGCAKKTLISYEKGKSIPNDNFMITLKTLIEHPEELGNRLKANSTSFSTQKINKIENKLDNFLKNNTKQLLLDNDIKLTEFNGYTPLMKDKLINMILLFSKEEINKTKLLKEMFYADFLYFKNNGLSITGLEYSKLPFGPVPDEFESILNNYAERNDISYNVIYHNNFEEDIIKSQRKSDLNVFENSELETINTIKNIFKDYSVTDIVNYSHKEKAYTDTKLFKKISYDYALDINISE